MTACPICATKTERKHGQSPYFDCPNCHCWFQWPQPPKTYIADFEGDPSVMSEGDVAVNEALADHLFAKVMNNKPGLILDIGAKLPVLAARLMHHGCAAYGMEYDLRAFTNAGLGEKALGVTMVKADFEDRGFSFDKGTFSLITLIHTFEHLYDPVAALRKLRKFIADDGRAFLRLPQHDVPGYERDLTEGHYSIHPFYHCLSSILEALAQVKDCFVIESMDRMNGHGQADIVLRPIVEKPRLAVGIIAKNEERDLPLLLDSIEGVADKVVLVDTGSTDNTMDIAEARGAISSLYLGASRFVDGQWKLEHFSDARNHAITLAEALGCDWYAWFDADDVLATPAALRRALYNWDVDVWGMHIQSGGYKWIHHRVFKMEKHLRFKGRCHEFLVMDGCRVGEIPDSLIVHNLEPGASQEDSNVRNLRMLTMEWDEDPSPRCAFYLANTHKDAGRFQEAAEWYQKRIDFGEGFRDEYLFALLYKSRCHRLLKDFPAALETAAWGFVASKGWAEFTMEGAYCHYDKQEWAECIATATTALDIPITTTHLWREHGAYRDGPARLISWSQEHLGNRSSALVWAQLAKERIGGDDREWDARMARLRAPEAPAVKTKHDVIALCRPGAIGDILMTLNLIPALKEANPGKPIWYFCDKRLGDMDALGGYMMQAGVDQVMDCASWDQWAPSCERAVSLVGYPLAEGYPEKPMRMHLLEYFAREMGVSSAIDVSHMVAGLPSLTLPLPPRPKRPSFLPEWPYASLQREAGWSRYKMWFPERWQKVMEACAGLNIPLWPVGKDEGLTLAQSIAVIANAQMHIGIDSFGNHLTNYYWSSTLEKSGAINPGESSSMTTARKVRGVILWGSTQPSAAGYPENINIYKNPPCGPCFRENPAISRQPRGPCVAVVGEGVWADGMGKLEVAGSYDDPRRHACMDAISTDEVIEAIRKLWKETS